MSEDIQNMNTEEQSSAASENHGVEKDMLGKAIGFAQQGKIHEARRLLQTVLEGDRDNEMAWMWLASTYASDHDRLRLLQYYLDRHPESDPVSKAVLAIRERINRRKSRAAIQEVSAGPAPHTGADVQEAAVSIPQARRVDRIHQKSQGNGVRYQKPAARLQDEDGESASESKLLLVAIAVIAVTVISALLWTILT